MTDRRRADPTSSRPLGAVVVYCQDPSPGASPLPVEGTGCCPVGVDESVEPACLHRGPGSVDGARVRAQSPSEHAQPGQFHAVHDTNTDVHDPCKGRFSGRSIRTWVRTMRESNSRVASAVCCRASKETAGRCPEPIGSGAAIRRGFSFAALEPGRHRPCPPLPINNRPAPSPCWIVCRPSFSF